MKIIKINALWCPACLITNNNLNKVLKNYKNIEIEDFDYDYDDIEKYSVGKTLPVLIFMKNGMEVKRLIGEKTVKELESCIGELYEEV